MASFEKALEVDDDLRSIVVYTADRWGVEQVRKYMAGLDAKMEAIATGQAHTTRLDHVIKGLRVGRYERHYIFGVERLAAPMLVLAVFHEKMSVIERLKGRL
jgi:toxin ParE1/3/4